MRISRERARASAAEPQKHAPREKETCRPSSHGLSPERHRLIGAELARVRDQLDGISAEIMGAWPRRSAASDRASAIVGPVDKLRDELDARFRVEHEDDYSPGAYYPPRSIREAPGMPSLAVQHALARKIAEARRDAEGSASPEAKDAVGQAFRALGRMHVAVAALDADEAARAMATAVSWAETAQREARATA